MKTATNWPKEQPPREIVYKKTHQTIDDALLLSIDASNVINPELSVPCHRSPDSTPQRVTADVPRSPALQLPAAPTCDIPPELTGCSLTAEGNTLWELSIDQFIPAASLTTPTARHCSNCDCCCILWNGNSWRQPAIRTNYVGTDWCRFSWIQSA